MPRHSPAAVVGVAPEDGCRIANQTLLGYRGTYPAPLARCLSVGPAPGAPLAAAISITSVCCADAPLEWCRTNPPAWRHECVGVRCAATRRARNSRPVRRPGGHHGHQYRAERDQRRRRCQPRERGDRVPARHGQQRHRACSGRGVPPGTERPDDGVQRRSGTRSGGRQDESGPRWLDSGPGCLQRSERYGPDRHGYAGCPG